MTTGVILRENLKRNLNLPLFFLLIRIRNPFKTSSRTTDKIHI